ncbi:hypothetical protein R1080702_055 [Cyanophage S-RIM32]|uniref:Uncharacterized protein n=1 Tax=Cyanophage S-RIM32 TaxID=1278479 RepID=A0A127KLV2_9CAUD|nr:hypothetical protein BJD26_gp201 [Cyanophage S-RIM32]AMO43064.1 hypothetical protein R1080702_055 [Cyanophage S-RIM32]
MTYEATVEFKFDATYTHDYSRGFGSTIGDDDFLPEEHFLITAPAADLNAKQYFKLFEKFMLCVGMCPSSIRSGAMSLVFNDWTNEEEQRKVCKEYELTMDEDLEKKYQEFKQRDEEWAKLNKQYKEHVVSEPKIKGDWEQMTDEEREHQWEKSYWQLYRRFQRFAIYSDDQLNEMVDAYERLKIDSANGVA